MAFLSSAQWDDVLADALAGRSLDVVYQPVVDLRCARIVGYEALARFAVPSWVRPDDVFRAARARGVVARLDAVALDAALAGGRDLPRDCFLAVNLEPDSLGHPAVDAALRRARDRRAVVVELTEHVPLDPDAGLDRHLAEHRANGVRVALDDTGSGYAGLSRILHLRPALLKLDGAIVSGLADDPAKAALIATLTLFARRIGADLLAEGVECMKDAAALDDLGVPLAQGFFFAAPAAPFPALGEVARRFLDGRATRTAPRKCAGGAFPPPLAALVAPAAAVRDSEARPGALTGAHTVVLDDDGRAVALIDAAGVRTATPSCVRVDASLADAIASMLSRPAAERLAPVACGDARGRFVGLLYPERLLEALGAWAGAISGRAGGAVG